MPHAEVVSQGCVMCPAPNPLHCWGWASSGTLESLSLGDSLTSGSCVSLVGLTVAAGTILAVLESKPGAGTCWSSWMGLTEAAEKLRGLQQPAGQGSSAKLVG